MTDDHSDVSRRHAGQQAARRIAVFSGISALGDRLSIVGLMLWVADGHGAGAGSAAAIAGLLLADLLPGLLLGPLGGAAVDRFTGGKFWVSMLVLQAGIFGALAFHVTYVWVLAATVASSLVTAISGAATSTMCRRLVDDDLVGWLSRWLSTAPLVASVLGAAVGAAMYARVSIEIFVLLNAVSYLVLAVAALGCVLSPKLRWAFSRPGRGVPVATTSPGRRRRRLSIRDLYSWNLLTARSVFGAGAFAVWGIIFGTSLEGVVGVFVLRGTLSLSDGEYGVALAVWSVGAAVGASVDLKRFVAQAFGRQRLVAFGAVGMGAVFIGVVVGRPHAWLVIAAFAVGGVANGVINTVIVHSIGAGADASNLGRTWGQFRMLANSAVVVGLTLGWFAGSERTVLFFVLAGAVPVAVGVFAGLRTLFGYKI